ncbi:MAG: hypothetical protein A2Z49_07830 [Chloroflexi bacterium RBG_19FT_COMBO_56_12]|nr:MAG: hypothetical protein A2Z49_07830 [Chloroflexi bacterium RBG_19FT_COMBO_56_12]
MVWMGVYDEHCAVGRTQSIIDGEIGKPGTFSGYSGTGHIGLAQESKGEPIYIANVTLQPWMSLLRFRW